MKMFVQRVFVFLI